MKKIMICILISIIIFLIINLVKKIIDNKFYKNITLIDNPNDLLVLVNKNNKINKEYKPKDLEMISLRCANKDKYLRHEARIAFEKMCNAALSEGYNIIAVSAYRSYEYQEKLFTQYIQENGLNYALKCSAKPGHSEHQTGLSVDIMGSNLNYNMFNKTKEFKWMKKNAYKYGFIIRYPKGKYYITGFKYEPWHYRYVGKKNSSIITNEKLTLEEYIKNA